MTNITGRISAFFCVLFLCQSAQATLLYSQDWEGATAPLSRTGILRNGACFSNPPDAFNSIELSTNHVFQGSQSLRMELRDTPCPSGISGLAWIAGMWRNELGYGDLVTGLDTRENEIGHGQEIWIRYALYFPSNEGTNWWSSSTRTIISQLIGGGNSSTPEVHAMIGNNGRLDFEQTYSTAATGENLVKRTDSTYINRDEWNTVVINWKRTWENTGKLKIWVNGTQLVNRINEPTVIRNKPFAFAKIGPYGNPQGSWRVMYVDDVAIYDESETYESVTAGGTQNPGAAITSVNDGSAIVSEASAVPYVATVEATAATNCTLSTATQSTAAYPVMWDYTNNDGGQFDVPDTSGFTSSTGTISCDYKPYSQLMENSYATWSNSGTATVVDWSGSEIGYTTGIYISTTDAGAGTRVAGFYGSNPVLPAFVQGDQVEFQIDYKPDSGSENYLYFAYAALDGQDDRNEARGSGTNDTLILEDYYDGIGTNRYITQQDLGGGNKRLIFGFTIDAVRPSITIKPRFGFYGATGTKGVRVYSPIVVRKNAIQGTATGNVTYSITDNTAPTLSNCASDFAFASEPGGENSITAGCDTNEFNGTMYFYRSTSATPPSLANLKACTGGDWCASTQVSTETNVVVNDTDVPYAASWMHIAHTDAAANDSSITTVHTDIPGGDPIGTKKIKFADDYDGVNDSRIYDPDGVTLRSTQIDVICVYTSQPMYQNANSVSPVAGCATNKTPTAGVLTLTDTELDGQISSLADDTVVWIDAWNTDGSFKLTRKIKVIEE